MRRTIGNLLRTTAIAGATLLGAAVLGVPAANATAHEGATHVPPGGSIQDAVNAAHPGDTIALEKGTYTGGILVNTNGITIRGDGHGTVLVPGATNNCPPTGFGASGICVVGDPAHPVGRVHIDNLTVRGFANFGIVGFGTDRLTVTEVTAANNGEYGITEFGSTRGRFTENRVLNNAIEAGLYVGDIGDAKGTVVADNYASGNALGVLVRHAHNVRVSDNTLVGNCTGIALVDDGQPGGQGDTRVTDNLLSHNNKVCPPNGDVPPLGGTGIAILGGSNNKVTDNEIRGNSGTQPFSGGVVLLPGVSGNPANGNVITENEIEQNSPADVIDHSGGTNTFADNDCDTSMPTGLC
jgi:hypothetical protein